MNFQNIKCCFRDFRSWKLPDKCKEFHNVQWKRFEPDKNRNDCILSAAYEYAGKPIPVSSFFMSVEVPAINA